ncbi:WRKY transcription factor 55 [Actinidia eriantha]|uniref:WRKY transcription factor 55 n=1 Tax=Actinidia eriantha TaxID=165200 RepID=UPI0025864AC9|nr:WRKY transcription factor 55 [Actinidia eriantha]
MEETNSLVLYACKLARDLELSFPNMANNPSILLSSCDEIIRVFSMARDRLSAHESQVEEHGGRVVQEWLRSTQAMSLLHTQFSGVHVMGGRDTVGGLMQFSGGGVEVPLVDLADSGGGSSSQRPRRRKDDVGKRTVMVPAPRMGNTEIPPDDGYTWRKYGQKEILGSRFPRGYYRCTHQKQYHCPAKKQVQRLNNDPTTFQVTYHGDHTCHLSSLAPSALTISAQLSPPSTTYSPPMPPVSAALGRWLSMDIQPMVGGGSAGAGPSTVRFGREVDYQWPVTDLADAMFNSGSSSNNSIELIFSSMEEKSETGERKT